MLLVRFICIMSAVVLLISCGDPARHLRVITHANGLVLSMPDSLELGRMEGIVIDQTAAGFNVHAADWKSVRNPAMATVDLRRGDAEPVGEWPDTRTIDGRTIHYRIDANEGGSGGTEYALQAWEPAPGGYILYQQRDQAEEPAKPRFDLVWKMIEGTNVPRAAKQ